MVRSPMIEEDNYEKLLEVFWRNVDPLTPNRQFCDVGSQYRTAIFTTMKLKNDWGKNLRKHSVSVSKSPS